MKQNEVKVTFYLKKSETNDEGRCPVMAQLSMARHNFGTHITLSMVVPLETVSRMMGHKSISTTQIYAHITDKKVDEDMKRLKSRIAGKNILLYEGEKMQTLNCQ